MRRSIVLFPCAGQFAEKCVGARVTNSNALLEYVRLELLKLQRRGQSTVRRDGITLDLPSEALICVSAGHGRCFDDVARRYHLVGGKRYLKRSEAYRPLAVRVMVISDASYRRQRMELLAKGKGKRLAELPPGTTHVVFDVEVTDESSQPDRKPYAHPVAD